MINAAWLMLSDRQFADDEKRVALTNKNIDTIPHYGESFNIVYYFSLFCLDMAQGSLSQSALAIESKSA